MSGAPVSGDGGAGELLAVELRRIGAKLGTMPLDRLEWPAPGQDVTRSEAVARAVRHLAGLAREAEGLAPVPVPVLRPHGWADQLGVLVHDLRAAGPGPGALDRAAAELTALRRAL